MKKYLNLWCVLCAAALGATSQSHGAELGEREFDLVLTRNPDLRNGAELYGTCAACHGAKGEGVNDGSVPALAGQPYSVLAKQIVAFRSGVRDDARMAHFSDRTHLSFSQPIADVAAYISKLAPSGLSASRPREGDARGALAYARNCERCHGSLAEGNDETSTPRLASQHYEYLMKQLDAAAAGRRKSMSNAHGAISAAMSRDELASVARYLASISP